MPRLHALPLFFALAWGASHEAAKHNMMSGVNVIFVEFDELTEGASRYRSILQVTAGPPREQELQLRDFCTDLRTGFGGTADECVGAFLRLLSMVANTEEVVQLQTVDAQLQAEALSEAQKFVGLMFKPPPESVAKEKKAYTSGSGGAVRSMEELAAINGCRQRFTSDAGSFLRWYTPSRTPAFSPPTH